MRRRNNYRLNKSNQRLVKQRTRRHRNRQHQYSRPVAAHRERGTADDRFSETFNAPEVWHEPRGRKQTEYVIQPPGAGYIHPVSAAEVADRLRQLPSKFTAGLEVIQFSRMTRKRRLFPCYGMQWGPNIYLYGIEESLVETYVRPPRPQQLIEAKMYGGVWSQQGGLWRLTWTEKTIRDFYLNNVLIHEVGHINDLRNNNFDDRERYANWFAVEHGYRASRNRR